MGRSWWKFEAHGREKRRMKADDRRNEAHGRGERW